MEPDGYAVLIDDKVSAPKGYWFVGCYTTKAIADDVAKKQPARVMPIYFALSASGRCPHGYKTENCGLCNTNPADTTGATK